MTRAEILAHNVGVAAVAGLAQAAAGALQARLTDKPTRYVFAIEALDALVEASGTLMLPLPGGDDGSAPVAAQARPNAPAGDAAAAAEHAA